MSQSIRSFKTQDDPTFAPIMRHTNSKDMIVITELYKSYYTATEVSLFLGINYTTVCTYFRQLKIKNTPKYNRLNLIPEVIYDSLDKEILTAE